VSATDEVTAGADGRVSELIDARVPRDRAETVRAFANAFTRRLSSEDLAERTPEELFGIVSGAFELADSRPKEEVAVRVFDPDVATDGYAAVGTVIEISAPDAPFLLDSVNEELAARGLGIRHVIHPVIGTQRGPDGRLSRIVHVRDTSQRESVMHFELDRVLSDAEQAKLAKAIRRVLDDVRLAVRDFDAMQAAAKRMIDIAWDGVVLYSDGEVAETVAFLQWLLDLNFVFLGYREYELVDLPQGRALATVEGSGLGILSKPGWSSYEEPVLLDTIEPNLRARIEGGDLLIYSKTNRESTVHRRARMDYIGVRRVSDDGRIVGEARLIGLFTSKAYMEPASKTPLLHRKLNQILEAEDLFEGSHDYKAVVSIFESFPKDELFAASAEELREQVMGLLHLQESQHVRLFVRRDLYGRSVSLLVALPRDRFNAEVRQRLQALFMERFNGTTVDYHLSIAESGLAQLHFTVHVGGGQVPDVPFGELEEEVVEIARTWSDRLLERLIVRFDEARARGLFDRWAGRFPPTYQASTDVDLAVEDILRFEELEASDEPFVIGLSNQTRDDEVLTRVRLYKVGGRVELSDFVPMLEALGLRVIEEVPTTLLGE
jgi:glutamate dehydrogenase